MKKVNINFLQRRINLSNLVEKDSLIILSSSNLKTRNSDAHYPFRQNSNFYYLTGFDEPESLMLLKPNKDGGEFTLFCRDRDPLREQWDGFRAGQEGAVKDYGADTAYSITRLDELMPKLIEGVKNIYFIMADSDGLHLSINKWLDSVRLNTRNGSEVPHNFIALESILNEMRLIKSPEELEIMKIAGLITGEAHCNAMKTIRPGMTEYQLEAEYLNVFMKNGARFPAYTSIVGGGNNACILHYNENRDELRDGDLVLVDAGCEYQNYASDVTRTFPVGGKFSKEQKAIYEVVLEAHRKALQQIKPGNSWILAQEASVKAITQGLIDLKILEGELEELIANEEYTKFYMHRIGHWLGMDVHDVGDYKVDGKWRTLKEGMVLTIEPGIYILNSLQKVDAKWLGIGIRIEDDVLVTENGFEILTSEIPRDIQDIELLMQGN